MESKKSKNYIVCVSSYYPPHLGGLEIVAKEVAEHLAQDEKYDVGVVTANIPAQRKHIETKEDGRLVLYRLPAFTFAHTAWIPGLFFKLLFLKKPALFHLHLAQVYVPDIVCLVAKLRGIPYVIHFHLDVDRSGKLGFIFEWWKKWIQPLIIKGASKIITLSQQQTELIHTRYKIPYEKIRFIGNGVSEKFLSIGSIERKFNDPIRLLYVGRLSVQKRVERIVEAMALVQSEAILTIVGDGEDRAMLEKIVKEKNISTVTFAGRLDGERLLDAYKNNDVFLLPSDKEGMPLVALEAMATGLPIIGSDVLGITELIKGVGELVPDPSPEKFAKAIDSVANDKEKLEQMSRASYDHAKKFSWPKLVEELKEVYREII